MTQAVIAAITILAGILLGYWIRGHAAKAQAAELASTKAQLEQLRAESAARAGFQSLAAERERTIAQLTGEKNQLSQELQAKNDQASQAAGTIAELNAKLENEQKNLQEKLALLEAAKQTLANQFQALAADILEQKSKSFSEASQKELQPLLNPLRVQIEDFRKKVEEAQSDSKTGVTKLETLIGSLNGLNQQLSEDARNLTTALRGSAKTQGDWGELIARNLLEKAGLREGEQFRVQETFDSAVPADDRQRKARPDLIVNLPAGRHLIIDSKVSLNAYADSVNAENDDDLKAAIKRHLASVRAHIDELAERRYHRLNALDTPDFVVMFIPIEPAFLTALHEDESLWRYAYEKEVLLVGPTTLLFVIRIVDNLWQQERQVRNVRDVMDRGTELYDKFVGFVSDMEAIGDSLRKTDQSYTNAMKKLSEGRGNLIRQVEMLKQLGIRSSKAIPRNLLEAADVEADPESDTEREALSLAAAIEEDVARKN
ncbi:MAG TPA: DNA recombination protein RmuC [Terracidiphilus sp.]|nr:DNA recombination protein RmuC [Terracidiphilus sp.]